MFWFYINYLTVVNGGQRLLMVVKLARNLQISLEIPKTCREQVLITYICFFNLLEDVFEGKSSWEYPNLAENTQNLLGKCQSD